MRALLTLLVLLALLALGCERKVRVKLRVKSADAGLVSSSTTTAASAR